MDAAMHDALLIHFTGEKNAGVFLGALGVAVIAAAAVLARTRSDLRSCAATLGIVALIEIAIGVGLHLRTGPQVSRLTTQFASEPARFHSDEAARMARVQRNFVVIEYIEVTIVVGSAIAAVVWKQRPMPAGIALGLLVHAAFLLAFDIIAERRGDVYLKALETVFRPPHL